MAIPKRLRYEILRRDNFTCRYCGRAAPEVKLTIDHVVPEALGGTSDPANLVAACIDCNAGKSSTNPDSPLVRDVAQDALRWSRAMAQAHNVARDSLEDRLRWRDEFREQIWNEWTYSVGLERGKTVPLPPGWEDSIDRFVAAGLTDIEFREAVRIAMTNKARDTFAYMCGILWKWISERQEVALEIVSEDVDEAANHPSAKTVAEALRRPE